MITISSMSMGGAERRASILANYFVSKDIQVRICYLGNKRTPSAYNLDSRIEIKYSRNIIINRYRKLFSYIDSKQVLDYALRRKRLARFIRKYKPQVILSFMERSTQTTVQVCKGMNIPVIFVVANDISNKIAKRPTYIEDFINDFSCLAGVVFQTKQQKEQHNKRFPYSNKTLQEVISNPISESDFWDNTIKSENYEIVSVGRLVKQKNYPLLIEAFRLISDNYPKWNLTIYGEGIERENIQNLIAKYNLNHRITLYGYVVDIDKRLSQASMFVISSNYEGLPNALIEALCMGLPCISTDFDGKGARELIEDGKNGIIVPCNNPEYLSKAMERLMNDNEFALELGKNAKDLRSRLSVDYIGEMWIRFVEKTMSSYS